MDKLHILGAGTPTPTPTRFGSAYILEIENEKIMFDCGPATTQKLITFFLLITTLITILIIHVFYFVDGINP